MQVDYLNTTGYLLCQLLSQQLQRLITKFIRNINKLELHQVETELNSEHLTADRVQD